MKKYILPILFLLSLSSCKEFLEEKMVSTITQDYFETEKGAEELVVASYNTLRWKYGFMEGPYLFETGTDLTEPTDNNWATIKFAM